MTPEEAVAQITESFISNMAVGERDPWDFFDWTRNTWGFQQIHSLQTNLSEIIHQERPSPESIGNAVRITRAVFGATGVPFNESAHGLGQAAAEVFRSALRVAV